jgi:hypothetical protein
MDLINTQIRIIILSIGFLFWGQTSYTQSLVSSPCGNPLPAVNEWTDGDCSAVTTSGFINNFNITSCGPGSAITIDGWGWYTGTGGGSNDITFTPSGGGDAVIQVFESAGDPCVQGFFLGECSDAAGAGGAETVTGGGTAGTVYIFVIENAASSGSISGTLCMTENPASCSDGIQNNGEAGVDCGGSCPAPCPPPTTSSQSTCPTVLNSTLDTVTCNVVGTPFFNTTSGLVNFASTANTPWPSPKPTCGTTNGPNTDGTWALYDPVNGVSVASLDVNNTSGSADISAAFYQGTGCGGLVQVGCDLLLVRSGPNFILQSVNVAGIDDAEPLYMFVWSSKSFSFEGQLQGFPGAAVNDDCSSAIPATLDGCNVAATGASFTPPSNFSQTICSGGTWFSNENTVFYSFTPTNTAATLEIDGITCNDGQIGEAQFGVWESCAAMSLAPTAANGFLGCVVGNDPLVLSGLTIGQTYFIAVDGQAGDWCAWNFAATGGIVLLYVDLLSFEAVLEGEDVLLDWETESEKETGSFTLQRSTDGINYEDLYCVIDKNSPTLFSATDMNPFPGVSYYRLKITEINGSETYSDISAVTREDIERKDRLYIHNVYPKPSSGVINIDLEVGEAEELTVKLVNNLGQIEKQRIITVAPGLHNKISMDFGEISAGIYALIIENKSTMETMLERIQIRN